MSTLSVDTITEKSTGNGVQISGHVIQVQQTTGTTSVTTTSAGWTNGAFSVIITPKSTSSKILVMYNIWAIIYGQNKHLTWDLVRTIGGTQSGRLGGGTYGLGSIYTQGIAESQTMCHIEFLDSPNTTSAVTYTPQFNNYNTGTSLTFGEGSRKSTVTAMEIAQ